MSNAAIRNRFGPGVPSSSASATARVIFASGLAVALALAIGVGCSSKSTPPPPSSQALQQLGYAQNNAPQFDAGDEPTLDAASEQVATPAESSAAAPPADATTSAAATASAPINPPPAANAIPTIPLTAVPIGGDDSAAPEPPLVSLSADDERFIAAMHAARGHYYAGRRTEALAALHQALAIRRDSPEAQFDLLLVTVAVDGPAPSKDEARQAARLGVVQIKELGNDPATIYLTAIAQRHAGRLDTAIELLGVLLTDPAVGEAPVQVTLQLAEAMAAAGRHAEAAEQLRAVTLRDRYNEPAFEALAAALKQAHGPDHADCKEAAARVQWLANFRTRTGRARLSTVRCAWTQFRDPPLDAQPRRAAIRVEFVNITEQVGLKDEDKEPRKWRPPALLIPRGPDEPPDLLLGRENHLRLLRWTGDRYKTDVEPVVPADPRLILTATLADMGAGPDHPLGRYAVMLTGVDRRVLMTVRPDGTTAIVEGAIESLAGKGFSANWLDGDGDGDLDLLIVGGAEQLEYLQSMGNGTFVDDSSRVRVTDATNMRYAGVADLNLDGAPELLFSGHSRQTVLLQGSGLGEFRMAAMPDGSELPRSMRAVIDDFDNDGRPDAALGIPPPGVGTSGKILFWSFGDKHARELLIGSQQPYDLCSIDYDNDGWRDILMLGRQETGSIGLRLWRNRGAAGWMDVSREVGVEQFQTGPARLVVAGDIDNDGDSDIVAATEVGGVAVFRNDGGNANRQLKLRLTGTHSNPSGLCAVVQVRGRRLKASRCVTQIPIEIGVGPDERIDELDVRWQNGRTDALLDVPTGKALEITESRIPADVPSKP